MSALLRWVGVVAVLALVAVLVRGERAVVTQTSLEKLLAYPLQGPLVFALEANETEVRLATWLSSPAEPLADARRSEVYAIGLTLKDPDGVVVQAQEVWLPTVRSWLMLDQPLRPQRLIGDPSRDLWDDRSTRITLDGLLPRGGVLEITPRHIPRGADVLVVAHRRAPSDPMDVLRKLRRHELDRAEPIAPWPVSRMPMAWQTNLAGSVWERMGALPPRSGGIPRTVRLETHFDHLPSVDAPTLGAPVPAGGALAWLIDGETVFEATISDLPFGPPNGRGTVRVRPALGPEQRLPIVDGRVGPIAVSGPTEITVARDADAGGLAWIAAKTDGGAPDRAIGVPPRLAVDGPIQRVAADLREVVAWRAQPNDPLVFAIAPDELAEFTLRCPMPAARRPGLEAGEPGSPVTVTWVAADGAGGELGRWSEAFAPVPSAFERYVRGADPLEIPVSEPLVRALRAPPGTARLTLWADAPIDVSLSVTTDPDLEPVLQPDYTLPDDALYVLRYEPHVSKPWHGRSPQGPESLAQAGRAMAIDAQVRFAPKASPPAGPSTDLPDREGADPGGDPRLVRHPLGLGGPFELLAEAAPGATDGAVRVGPWPTELTPPASGRIDLRWRVAADAVGRTVALRVGEGATPLPLVAGSGATRVDAGGSQPVIVSIDGADPDDLFLVAGTGPNAWRVRRVWTVPDGGELRIPIPAGEASLSVYTYRSVPLGRIRWVVEGDEPDAPGLYARVQAQTGAVSARWGGRPEALPLSYQGAPEAALPPITLRRDASAPAATLVLRPEGAGTVRVRALASWAPPAAEPASHARQSTAALSLGGGL